MIGRTPLAMLFLSAMLFACGGGAGDGGDGGDATGGSLFDVPAADGGGGAIPQDAGPGADRVDDPGAEDSAGGGQGADDAGGDPGAPDADDSDNTAPVIDDLPELTLEMGDSTTVDVNPYIHDFQDYDQALELSWTAEHVAISDPGTHVLFVVAPTDWEGTETVVVTVTDSGGLEDSTELVVHVGETGGGETGGGETGGGDTGGGDTGGGDTGGGDTGGGDTGGGDTGGDECAPHLFSYAAAAGVGEVLVAGDFTGWAASPWPLADGDGDGTWTLEAELDPGTYEYKFIVDGVWLHDPSNPNQVPDPFGDFNSVLTIAPCGGGDTGGGDTGGGDTGGGSCQPHVFSYAAAAGVAEVVVAGEFNGWGQTPWALADDDGDHTWTLEVSLDPGAYQYKLVVDGGWLLDPANPQTATGGDGILNSLLECAAPGQLALVGHATDQDAAAIEAVFQTVDGSAIDLDELTVTLDWAPLAVTGSDEPGEISIQASGLAPGIHDLRVQRGDQDFLLKFYLGVSTDWRDAVIYFAMTDRFANGDVGNDQPVADVDWRVNYQGGDFAGLQQRIESGYFDQLGVGALWVSWPVDNPDGYEDGTFYDSGGCGLSPANVNTSPMRYTGYHGYWPSQPDQVDEHFGTMADLQALVNAAHARGIRVLLDFTANHVHDSSPLWSEHQGEGWFNTPAEKCQDVGWDNKPKTCWFTEYLPDLNYNHPDARAALVDHAIGWVKQSGADGFRFDAVKHLEMSFIQELRARTKAELELTGVDFYIVGETFTGDAGLIQDFIGEDKIHAQFDFPTNMQLLQGFATRSQGLDSMDGAIRGIKGVYGGNALMSTFIGNHDIARFISMAAGDIPCGPWDVISNIAQGWLNPPGQPGDETPHARLRLAFAYIFTIPGVPLVYYGDEFGMPGAGDPDNRRFMRFGDDLGDLEQQTLAFMQTLGAVRAAHPALRRGTWSAPLAGGWDLLAYGRVAPEETAIVVLNLGDAPASGSLPVGGVGLSDGAELSDAMGGAPATAVSGGAMAFEVGARSVAIYTTTP